MSWQEYCKVLERVGRSIVVFWERVGRSNIMFWEGVGRSIVKVWGRSWPAF